MALSLRVAGRADIAAVDALLAKSYPILLRNDYPPSALVTVLPLISRAQPELVTSGTYLLVEEDGVLVGAGGWTARGPKAARSAPDLCHVRHVVTDHRAVRRGIGRALMTEVFRQARAAGHTRIEALSTLTAKPFYEALGFRALEHVDVPIGPAGVLFRAVRMEAPLGTMSQ